ncbi:MAG: ATP-dependent zinc metalloprotease FtsH [Proteobacteria bacterium]|nr:ATP-dependent zinc metalloprotease FtsH [Cystobacterineae bacterium]MCL2258725.1 ATP-dependent zinc metalloprotease FtsH [Cystobacterineae bacterium]MCL2314899.1 ATP-dependent zinc metalloprotease FtsH [Pseudomonadota bacterium]
MRSNLKNMGIWVLLITLFAVIYAFYSKNNENVRELPITAFLEKVKSKEISKVSIKENIYVGHLSSNPKETVRSIGPAADASILQKLSDENVEVRFERDEQGGLWLSLLAQSIPIILVVGLFIFFMRQLQGSSGKAMSFGKSKAKLLSENHNKLTFADVAGIDESKEELEEIIAFLKDPKKFTKLGGRIPKGVLMMGPPGTGKTLLAKAVAGEAGVPFFSISGSDFVEMFVGVGASRVRDLFEQGKKNAPCIIFIDEIDAVGRHRGAGLGGGHDEREQTLNQLLVEMDGFESSDGVILMAATNRPDVLDPALQRPGRFDRRVVVPRPDLRGRVGILKVHTRRTPLAPDVDLDVIARGTPGMTGADLENLVNEAALFAARRNKERVEFVDFETAKDKVFMGPERKSMIMTEKEKQNTAVHEAGHALIGKLLPGCDPVHKVTIIPRGQALGITWSLPTEDQLNRYRRQLKDELSMLLGGRVAEELVFDEMSAGATNDIERATQIARAMVCRWGMSDKLGPLSYSNREGEVFLGRDFASRADHSDETAKNIDDEIRKIVVEAYERSKALLSENLDLLKRVSDALVEYETLDAADLEVLIQGGSLTREKPQPRLTAPPKEEKKNRNILDSIDGLSMEPGKA